MHPYSEDRSPLDPGIAGWTKKSFIAGVPAVRDTMLRHGDDKPLWLTEFGWSTCNVRGLEAYRNCVDPAVQADYLRLVYQQMRAFTYVPVGVWYNLQDTSSDIASRVDNYGLLDYAGADKPAFTAFRTAALALGTSSPPPADTTPPNTSLSGGPTGHVTSSAATVGLVSTEAGSSFECRLDGAAWKPCADPVSLSALSLGSHTFGARARDGAGNADPTPASRTWSIVKRKNG